MMTETKESTLTKEDIDAINKDIEDAKSSLISKETDMKIEEMKKQAKEEAMKELEVQRKLEEQERMNKELQEKLNEKEKEASERLSRLQAKVDELASTKQAMKPADPFQVQEAGKINIKSLSEDDINDIETNSARAFFGEDLDERI